MSVALSGTAISTGILEAEVVTGSETVILTLTGANWHADIGADNSITDALIAGLTAPAAEAAGWQAQIIGGDGALHSKGLVNTREHLESLVEAMDSGVATLQDYMGSLESEYENSVKEQTL